jgi:hypothetical protein
MDLQQFLFPKIPVSRKHQYITVKSITWATLVFVPPIANLHTTITTPNSPWVCNVSPGKLDEVVEKSPQQ